MPLPVVLAVDESPAALGAVECQLTQRYARDYHVVCLSDSSVKRVASAVGEGSIAIQVAQGLLDSEQQCSTP